MKTFFLIAFLAIAAVVLSEDQTEKLIKGDDPNDGANVTDTASATPGTDATATENANSSSSLATPAILLAPVALLTMHF